MLFQLARRSLALCIAIPYRTALITLSSKFTTLVSYLITLVSTIVLIIDNGFVQLTIHSCSTTGRHITHFDKFRHSSGLQHALFIVFEGFLSFFPLVEEEFTDSGKYTHFNG